jgi:hypothetical protein
MSTTYQRAHQQGIALSPIELLGCWTALQLCETPGPLWLTPPGTTVEESRMLLARAVAGLAGRGLSDGVRPHPSLANMLRVIAGAELYLEIRFQDVRSGPSVLGFGAVSGARGVTLATTEGGQGLVAPMQLLATDGSRVASTLLGMLDARGPIKPGMGAPVNIPADAFDRAAKAAGGDPWVMVDLLRELGISVQESISVARMCTGIWLVGELSVIGRDGEREREAPWRVTIHAAERGWFMRVWRDGTVSMFPADGDRLMRQWQEMIGAVRGRTARNHW